MRVGVNLSSFRSARFHLISSFFNFFNNFQKMPKLSTNEIPFGYLQQRWILKISGPKACKEQRLYKFL
jgi:hypothetical protein